MATTSSEPVFRICFVCTGNICRSPMAEVIMRRFVEDRGLQHAIRLSSAGTGEWHVGEKADPRTRAALERAGYSGESHRAKQFDPDTFDQFDLILTFDRGQLRILHSWAEREQDRALVQPLLHFDPARAHNLEVPDPYYGDDELFDEVRDVIERACEQLLQQIEPAVRAAIDAASPR
ncbi:low molecular weight protein-tyrosine-phosphatase [Gulosibacter sp. 10]|uniref:low molecular weight protein-tyrosine-phosphatase n=1 Tax=Gulosibacter sp. 10 TaxID=1255570 RepID=UPI000B364021|nr:low molecular weight protein-tyrosine-phosphatase [Gulosibacter sp. 10]